VLDEVARELERLLAYIATERSVSGVRSLVAGERAVLCKRHMTYITGIPSVIGVDASVLPKITVVRKQSIAHVALVPFHVST